jgi:hypothetical protein
MSHGASATPPAYRRGHSTVTSLPSRLPVHPLYFPHPLDKNFIFGKSIPRLGSLLPHPWTLVPICLCRFRPTQPSNPSSPAQRSHLPQSLAGQPVHGHVLQLDRPHLPFLQSQMSTSPPTPRRPNLRPQRRRRPLTGPCPRRKRVSPPRWRRLNAVAPVVPC